MPILLVGASLSSCDDLFEPANEMISDVEVMYNDPLFASGLLGNAYLLMPYSGTPGSDLATDDAVANNMNNQYYKMAAGAWSAMNDPLSQWQGRNNAIQYINLMLENVDKVTWSGEPSVNQMFIDLMKGDALGMRAVQRFYLLRAHAGKVASGELMGVPFFDEFQTGATDFNQPRMTFKECLDAILADIDAAMALLPEEYGTIKSSAEIPSKYTAIGADMGGYNRAFGDHQHGKVSGKILKAVKAQVLLFAASPAYNAASWDEAAQAAADVLGDKEVVPTGLTWYANKEEIENVKRTENTPEAIWMSNPGNSNSLESDNFPPSIFGKGLTNPTQNLVDAFPMANGYPITDSRSGYNPNKPFEGRDPRLETYIVVDGSTIGVNDANIWTGKYNDVEKATSDNLNKELNASTRTGYYLRKLLRTDVNMDPATTTQQKHYTARIRWTEIFLAYAEAANEAYGPTQGVGNTKSAKEIIKKIRERAGICVGVADPYLDECASSKDKMRELIHNERRIELCFENHRFYDIRRWNEPLNASIKGINTVDGNKYDVIDVETLNYQDYQVYGPIPYSEIMKFGNLEQNQGW